MKPPSKSADGVKVGVPVIVIVSEPALPKVTFPFKVAAPETVKLDDIVAALVTESVPAIAVLPSPAFTVNLLVFTDKFPTLFVVPEISTAPLISIVVPLISISESDTKSNTPSAD